MIAWCVKKGKTTVWMEHFITAWEDWKSHPGELRWLFPVLVPRYFFNQIKEFDGW